MSGRSSSIARSTFGGVRTFSTHCYRENGERPWARDKPRINDSMMSIDQAYIAWSIETQVY